MCKLSLNIVPNVYISLQTSFLLLAWPWWGRLLPKGNQWKCWDPGLGPNVVRLPVHLPPLMHPYILQFSQQPYTPDGPQCFLTSPTPLGAPDTTYTPAGPWVPTLPASSPMPLTPTTLLMVPQHPSNTPTPLATPMPPTSPAGPLTPLTSLPPQCPWNPTPHYTLSPHHSLPPPYIPYTPAVPQFSLHPLLVTCNCIYHCHPNAPWNPTPMKPLSPLHPLPSSCQPWCPYTPC